MATDYKIKVYVKEIVTFIYIVGMLRTALSHSKVTSVAYFMLVTSVAYFTR